MIEEQKQKFLKFETFENNYVMSKIIHKLCKNIIPNFEEAFCVQFFFNHNDFHLKLSPKVLEKF